jgi:hypothetical protein
MGAIVGMARSKSVIAPTAGSYNSFLFVILAGWHAKVAELVDALALGASGVTRESSSLSFRTKSIVTNPLFLLEFREFQHAG